MAEQPTKLTNEDLEKAKLRLRWEEHRRANIAFRTRVFNQTEPAIYHQKYFGRALRGININSCIIASSIIGLIRMGILPFQGKVLDNLEPTVAEKAFDNGYFDHTSGNARISLALAMFDDLGIEAGYASSLSELNSCLKAGGIAVFQQGSHARALTEFDPITNRYKVFDPLPAKTTSEYRGANSEDITHSVSYDQNYGYSFAVVAYPPFYQREEGRHETFPLRLITPPPLQLQTSQYLQR